MLKLSREPALYLTLVATIVRLAGAFLVHLTGEQQALLNAAATAAAGLVVALWVRRDGQVAALLGVVQAGLALAVGLGAHISAEHQALIMSALGTFFALLVRTQVTAPVTADGDRVPL